MIPVQHKHARSAMIYINPIPHKMNDKTQQISGGDQINNTETVAG